MTSLISPKAGTTRVSVRNATRPSLITAPCSFSNPSAGWSGTCLAQLMTANTATTRSSISIIRTPLSTKSPSPWLALIPTWPIWPSCLCAAKVLRLTSSRGRLSLRCKDGSPIPLVMKTYPSAYAHLPSRATGQWLEPWLLYPLRANEKSPVSAIEFDRQTNSCSITLADGRKIVAAVTIGKDAIGEVSLKTFDANGALVKTAVAK